MDRNSMQRLRLDRRLLTRRNWIKQADLKRELEALPDAAAKVAPAEADASTGAAAQESPATE